MDEREIRRRALERAESASLARLGRLRGDLLQIVGVIDAVVPPRRAAPGASRLDIGNLLTFPHRQHRESNK